MDGVSIRLIINGAYLDEDIQDVVDRINNDWNITNGWDASAVIMSEDDDVMKLHNKGAIVDGESVLIQASIGAIQRWFAIVRWDSSSPLPRLLNPTSNRGMLIGTVLTMSRIPTTMECQTSTR